MSLPLIPIARVRPAARWCARRLGRFGPPSALRPAAQRWVTLSSLLLAGATAGWAATDTPGAANSTPPPPGISAKILRYAGRVIDRYDADGDGRLEPTEWDKMGGRPRLVDADGDAQITLQEMAQHVARYGEHRNIRLRSPRPETLFVFSLLRSPDDTRPPVTSLPTPTRSAPSNGQPEPRFFVPKSRLPTGLPEWFLSRDMDGDGQLTMSEFSQQASRAEASQFGDYDLNGDGVVTSDECAKASRANEAKASTGRSTPARAEPAQPAEARSTPSSG